MMCPTCHNEFEPGDRCQANVTTTFVFKPANVPDTVNGTKVSPDELAESRKEHTKTAISTVFFTYGNVPVPEGAMNVRHVACVVQRTASLPSGAHPMGKHSIRYTRNMARRVSR